MKCPKCQYLGFDTGIRCRNCGYDFSLLALADETGVGDVMLRPADPPAGHPVDPMVPAADEASSFDDLPLTLAAAGAADHAGGAATDASRATGPSQARSRRAQARSFDGDAHAGATTEPRAEELPLFSSPDDEDAPLIRMPASPRPPIAVRRTPEVPKVSRPPSAVRRDARSMLKADTVERREDPALRQDAPVSPGGRRAPVEASPCAVSQRALAAAIDAAVLGGLHLLVVYFTIRMAGLTAADWWLLPPVPLGGFLAALTLAYVAVFTAVGGQTIGKMATDIRVVSDDGLMTNAQAFTRAVAALGSVAVFGAGLAPAFFGEGRALHDRLVRTRVVAVRSAA